MSFDDDTTEGHERRITRCWRIGLPDVPPHEKQ